MVVVEIGRKKICNWVVILCEVMVLFSFRAGRVFSFLFFFNCCAYMIPNNDEACRQAGTFVTCSIFFCFLFLFSFSFSEVNGWYLGE